MNLVLNRKSNMVHRQNCKYVRLIKDTNKEYINIRLKEVGKFCSCKYCSTNKYQYVYIDEITREIDTKGYLSFAYDINTDALIVITCVGQWKIYKTKDNMYVLYHQNSNHKGYHRQKDQTVTSKLSKILKYIIKHDQAKEIINIDYRLLPQASKKQKKYYNIAKAKDRKHKINNVYHLLQSIAS